ncbi:MAG: porin [Alphaproteobacteria bacterium]|nr:porin [Alphaproteobacteria bacterium]
MGGVSAKAADLGGDCCADLEERVAELEATTARKGNRKVSLTIYGQVTTAVMFWDADGNGIDESNTYVVDPQTSSTRFGFKGKANITSDWSAGYNIELEFQAADASKVRVNNDEAGDLPEFRQAHWYLQSKTLGKVRVGLADMAASGIAEISVANELIADGMSSSQAGATIISRDLSGPGITNFETNRQNTVRYDTPEFGGFIASAAWGEDDIWDVALRYAGEFAGFKLAAGVAYAESTDSRNGGPDDDGDFGDDSTIEIVNGGLSVMHVATGLFVTASAGQRERSTYVGEDTFWHVTGGIEQKWSSLGKTTIFGMGGEFNDKEGTIIGGVAAVDSDSLQYYGGGVVQKIDAAAMDLFISYRHYDVNAGTAGAPVESDFDVVVGGGRIQF